MIRVRFHREAIEELFEVRTWYERRSEVAAQAFSLEVDHAIRRIGETPLMFPQGRRGECRFVLDRFPYTIMYRVREDHVFVTAIAHQRRRPGYWRRRR